MRVLSRSVRISRLQPGSVLLLTVLALWSSLVGVTAVSADAPLGDEAYDRAIGQLASIPEVERALNFIREEERNNLEPLIALTEIEAPPFAESARGERFAEMLATVGLSQVDVDAVGNVIGYWPGSGRPETVAVVAHLDTVFPAGTDVRVREGEGVDAGKWFAPGIGDNSRGLVLMLTLAKSMRAAGIETERNILFVGSVGEEGVGNLRGVKHLFREGGPRIDELIAIDGSNDQRVLNQAIGSHRYRVVIRGPGGHSWGAFGLANPAHAMASAIHQFDEEARQFVASGPRTTYNIGLIGGGTSVNAVPFESWAEVDLRSESPSRLLAIDELLRESFAQAVDDHNDARDQGSALELVYDSIGKRPSGVVHPQTPLIQRALAVARHFGMTPILGSGSTDANVAIAKGIPATTISRGGASGGAHSLEEWWSAENVEIGSQKALLLLLASAGIQGG